MATVEQQQQLYDVESAIAELLRLEPGLNRGNTATSGHDYYDKLASFGKQLRKCTCGQDTKNWTYPEFIVQEGDKTWSVGGDTKSNKISCGPNGFHSPRYGDNPPC